MLKICTTAETEFHILLITQICKTKLAFLCLLERRWTLGAKAPNRDWRIWYWERVLHLEFVCYHRLKKVGHIIPRMLCFAELGEEH